MINRETEVSQIEAYRVAGLSKSVYWNKELKTLKVNTLANYSVENANVAFIGAQERVFQMENLCTPGSFHGLFPRGDDTGLERPVLPMDLLIMGKTEKGKRVGWRAAIVSYDGRYTAGATEPFVNEFHIRWYMSGNANPELARLNVPMQEFGEMSEKWSLFMEVAGSFGIAPIESLTTRSTRQLDQESLMYDKWAAYTIQVPEDRTFLIAKI